MALQCTIKQFDVFLQTFSLIQCSIKNELFSYIKQKKTTQEIAKKLLKIFNNFLIDKL